MSNNILNDISKVYFGKIVSEKLDPVGQEDSDIDNDGKKNTKTDKYLLNRRRKIGSVIKTRKEAFSNWRDDLFEIADLVDNEQNKKQIKEKKVNNKVEINPKMNTEMIQIASELGGELIEMVEIGEETDYEREEKLRRRRQKLLKLQAKRKPISREKSDTLTKSSDEIIKSLRKEEIDSQSKKQTPQELTSQKPTPQELNLVRKQQQFKINALKQGKLPLNSEEYELDEKIDVGANAGKTISDFVHSKNKTFKGDSKKQRIKRALGAYYGAQKEETETIYNYVIETLVDDGFAQDYETAENMFEYMSDEFVVVILEEYIEEKARGTRPKKTVHAYDVDETLFGHGKKGKPNVQVHVKDASGKRVKSLSNQEFNTHKLDKDKGHSYDFSEFQSAKKFKETSSPNKKVIKDVKRKQARGQNVHIITARSKFDKPSEFQGHLKKHGVDVPMNKIHYTGGMKGGDIGQKKVDVAKGVAKQSGAKTTHMYDDAAKVHKAFEKEKKNKSTFTKIKTHLAKPNKSGETQLRSYQATKNEEK
jgi:hypothetical protein